jgi:hypothetical protein
MLSLWLLIALMDRVKDILHTASALMIWTRANRLWCNTVTGGLHHPLGKWLLPGPKLKQSWPFYFDLDTNTLWSWTGERFSVHSGIQIGNNSRNTQFHLKTNRQSTILSSISFPVDCRKTMTWFIITLEHTILAYKSSSVATIPAESNDNRAQSQRNPRDVTNICKTTNHCYRLLQMDPSNYTEQKEPLPGCWQIKMVLLGLSVVFSPLHRMTT